MIRKPIIIVAGEPYSVFLEIFFNIFGSTFIKKYKTPIISKKVIHEYDYTTLEELSCEVRHAVMRNPYKEIEITFKAKIEY